MKIYLATGDTKHFFNLIREEKAKHVLVSYAYFSSLEEYNRISESWYPEDLILDSGAFTVWTKGSSIDIDAYAKFCKSMRQGAWPLTKVYNVNLDVLPGRFGQIPTVDEREESARQGWKNAEYLENLGVKVLPVFHQYEDMKWLKKMYDNYEYFGISPANDVSVSARFRWLRKVFSIIKSDRKTHGFGVTSPRLLTNFPFYSVDSSSWAAGARYGRIPTYGHGKTKSFAFKDKDELLANWNSMKVQDISMLDKNYLERSRHGIKAFREMENFVTDLWASRNVSW